MQRGRYVVGLDLGDDQAHVTIGVETARRLLITLILPMAAFLVNHRGKAYPLIRQTCQRSSGQCSQHASRWTGPLTSKLLTLVHTWKPAGLTFTADIWPRPPGAYLYYQIPCVIMFTVFAALFRIPLSIFTYVFFSFYHVMTRFMAFCWPLLIADSPTSGLQESETCHIQHSTPS